MSDEFFDPTAPIFIFLHLVYFQDPSFEASLIVKDQRGVVLYLLVHLFQPYLSISLVLESAKHLESFLFSFLLNDTFRIQLV